MSGKLSIPETVSLFLPYWVIYIFHMYLIQAWLDQPHITKPWLRFVESSNSKV